MSNGSVGVACFEFSSFDQTDVLVKVTWRWVFVGVLFTDCTHIWQRTQHFQALFMQWLMTVCWMNRFDSGDLWTTAWLVLSMCGGALFTLFFPSCFEVYHVCANNYAGQFFFFLLRNSKIESLLNLFLLDFKLP
jgi:hypothetical protein